MGVSKNKIASTDFSSKCHLGAGQLMFLRSCEWENNHKQNTRLSLCMWWWRGVVIQWRWAGSQLLHCRKECFSWKSPSHEDVTVLHTVCFLSREPMRVSLPQKVTRLQGREGESNSHLSSVTAAVWISSSSSSSFLSSLLPPSLHPHFILSLHVSVLFSNLMSSLLPHMAFMHPFLHHSVLMSFLSFCVLCFLLFIIPPILVFLMFTSFHHVYPPLFSFFLSSSSVLPSLSHVQSKDIVAGPSNACCVKCMCVYVCVCLMKQCVYSDAGWQRTWKAGWAPRWTHDADLRVSPYDAQQFLCLCVCVCVCVTAGGMWATFPKKEKRLCSHFSVSL